ncbi:MAG: VapC toxin family PIN domain ribonuclease [Gammaproteobacteria bacterium]|nr:VapC toxin family PIN domain ribonuclease [Gammaproteobacteria bacterium]MCY4227087.1 VapC toxin family PIN domain ribonuclease [Gammaproteobacteria bacterium]
MTLEASCTTDNLGHIGHITLCELAWVLEVKYKQGGRGTEISAIIEKLQQIKALKVAEPDVVWRALNDYKTSNADFPDHLVARANENAGCEYTVTFDKHASKQLGFAYLAFSND